MALAVLNDKKWTKISLRKLSLFAEDMILYLKDPIESTRKLLNLINKYSKVTGYKNQYKNSSLNIC